MKKDGAVGRVGRGRNEYARDDTLFFFFPGEKHEWEKCEMEGRDMGMCSKVV